MQEIDDINPFADETSVGGGNQATDGSDNVSVAPSDFTTVQSSPPPLPTKHTFPQSPAQRPTQPKVDFCCARDRWLHSGEDTEIQIIDAQKTSEGSSATYITYVIRTGSVDARRRYSEFESLRNSLVKLYPTLIIPPIPSKTSIGDYAVKQGKAKEDINMIAKRRRLLHSFLNRIARHPILSNEHVFHRFLQSDVSWSEVLHSMPISQLPKNMLKAPSHSPIDMASSQLYEALPAPSATQPLRNPDQRFLDSEAFTDKFASHMSGPMEKTTRRLMKRWTEYAQDHADLGAALNGFSLNEEGPLAAALEKTGQAIDITYLSTSALLQELESNWAEPLHEYSQFAEIIRKLLIYRHQKHVQYEMTQQMVEQKKEHLSELERVESEAKRLDEALATGRAPPPAAVGGARVSQINGEHEGEPSPPSPQPGESSSQNGEEDHEPQEENSLEADTEVSELPAYSPPRPSKRRAPGMGLLNALSYTIQGMMDVDPETARRSSISKTRESISQLEDALQASAQDVKYSSSTIQADLDRFQRQKVADLRDMAIAMAISHREWLKKNLAAWEEVKKEVVNIPPHPNDVLAGDEAIDKNVPPPPRII